MLCLSSYTRGPWDDKAEEVATLALCAIKPAHETELRFCMEVAPPHKRVYTLQAHSAAACQDWIRTMRRVAEAELSGGTQVQAVAGREGESVPCTDYFWVGHRR